MLCPYVGTRRKQWQIAPYVSLRVRVREEWFAVPDFCVYPLPDFEGRFPTKPPLLWIEILSTEDRMIDIWNKANELVALGVPYVWIIDPERLQSELRTAAGILPVPDKTLRLPDSPIVIPLAEVMQG
jgi:Uma2 family endonuclease